MTLHLSSLLWELQKNIKVPFYNILSERDSMYIITPWLATSLYIVDCWGSTEYSHLASSLWSGDTGTVDWSGQSSVRAGQCRSEDKRRQSWWSPALQLQSDFSSSLSSFRPVGAGTAPPEVSQNILLLFFILVEKNIYFIFPETCTADCPQFLEDRQKLGEQWRIEFV